MMETVFDVSEETTDRYRVVTVTGEVDVATAPKLRDRLDGAIDGGTPLLVVDLSSVTFIDSTGLGVLIGAAKRVEDAGGILRLVIAEPRILKLFEITGLLDLFAIVSSREQAIAG
jgi:anti-sigma B factor antagonist